MVTGSTVEATDRQCNWSTYLGLFLIALATLIYELLLVRILSVTMSPQLAFIAISIVMFGMTVGALLVYLLPSVFKPERTTQWLTGSAALFALTGVASMYAHLQTRFNTTFEPTSFLGLGLMAAIMSVPFILSGICICLALTSFSAQISKLYAADLLGASLGCILLPLMLKVIDGVTAVILVGCLASAGALSFSTRSAGALTKSAAALMIVLLACIPLNLYTHIMRIHWVKGSERPASEYEKWNSYSRLTFGSPSPGYPFFWARSAATPEFKANQVYVDIDSAALTVMPSYNGNLSELEYLKYDLTNVGHYLRKNADVLVIGVGGGRDILSALVFGQRKVTAVEINESIIDLLRTRYADFTRVAFDPRVHLVNEDARSFVARTPDRYDFIHISLVDTFAATASGAYTFSENSIYTLEAWRLFLQRLKPDGILSFTHWFEEFPPTFFNRIVCIACTALRLEGKADPRQHIIIISNRYLDRGIATLLVSQTPFSTKDMATIRQVAKRLDFKVPVDPEQYSNQELVNIIAHSDSKQFLDQFDYRMEAATDDNPFVFCQRKFDWHVIFEPGTIEGAPLTVVSILSLIGIVLPLFISRRKIAIANCLPYFLYFAAIGVGFMFFEISQLQRLSIFLGHPNYSLSVVLATLLLSTGIGSYLTQSDFIKQINQRWLLAILPLVMVLYGPLVTTMISTSQSASIALRIVLAVIVLFPVGLALGMAFPLGLSAVIKKHNELGPWMWAMNGAASVVASVIAVLVAMTAGITMVFRLAIVSYLVALLAFFLFSLDKEKSIKSDDVGAQPTKD